MRIARSPRWAEDRADHERAIGIEDRPPIIDTRPVHSFDFRADGGQHWQAEPRAGFVSYRLRDVPRLPGAVGLTMLTAAQVAPQLGLSVRAVYDLAASGAIPSFRVGAGRGAVRFEQHDPRIPRGSAS